MKKIFQDIYVFIFIFLLTGCGGTLVHTPDQKIVAPMSLNEAINKAETLYPQAIPQGKLKVYADRVEVSGRSQRKDNCYFNAMSINVTDYGPLAGQYRIGDRYNVSLGEERLCKYILFSSYEDATAFANSIYLLQNTPLPAKESFFQVPQQFVAQSQPTQDGERVATTKKAKKAKKARKASRETPAQEKEMVTTENNKTEGAAPLPVRVEETTAEPTVKPEPIPQNIQRSGYTLEYETMVFSLTKGAHDSAFAQADTLYQKSQKTDGAKQNKYLSLLERGKVALAARKFDQSIADLQEAEKRFLTIEGTISLTEGFGSILTDDTAMEYEAEMHEKLMISPYLIIAHLSTGDFNGAIVERNRTITKINQYIEEKPEERAYLENPFARYLTAILYEMEEKKDDAKIEYKKLKRDEEIVRIDSKKGATTDLVIFVDIGLAPQKFERKWGPTPIPGVGVVGFAYAEYAPTPTEVTTCSIYLNEKSIGNANLLYDLENTVITQYDKNKPALQAKIVARMTAKAATQFAAKMAAKEVLKHIPFASMFANVAIDAAGAAWMAAEQADLRGWLSLPKQIKYLRVNGLEPGEHTIKIDYGCGVETKKIKVEKDKINVAYFVYAK
jgi:hypothetical protein